MVLVDQLAIPMYVMVMAGKIGGMVIDVAVQK
jgi:hypothetical protein